MATEYMCGKCEGTDWYPAVQVMNSGGANWGTKRIEVATCRKCDITMRKRKVGQADSPNGGASKGFTVFVLGLLFFCIAGSAFLLLT